MGLGNQNQAALTAGGESSLVQLRITVDSRTNSIIASGSPSDLDVMYALLLRLDQSGISDRTTEVVWLRNSNAQDLATAITNLITQQRQIINQTLLTNQAIGPFEQIDREVLVVAEPTTNSLIVSATPRFSKQIRAVIERLDRRPPLVMVQILLAEVTLEDNLDFGVEWGLQDSLLFDRGSATGGTLGSPAFNLGPTLTNTVTAGRPVIQPAKVCRTLAWVEPIRPWVMAVWSFRLPAIRSTFCCELCKMRTDCKFSRDHRS